MSVRLASGRFCYALRALVSLAVYISLVNRAARLARHGVVAGRLGRLGDRQLVALLKDAAPAGAGIGGSTATLDVDDVPVFAKSVPLTELERRPEHVRSTANMFALPVFYQYGIGSTGFGAWRELAVHVMTTDWVLEDRWQGFPIMYRWRVLPRSPASELTAAELSELERTVTYWEGRQPYARDLRPSGKLRPAWCCSQSTSRTR